MADLEYHDIGEYCKVQVSNFLNYLCNGCTWDNEYRRDLTKLIKDIIDEVKVAYDFKLYIPDLFEQIEQKFYGKYINIEKGMKEKIHSFIMNCLTVNVKATDNKRPISDLYKKCSILNYQDLVDIYNFLSLPTHYHGIEFLSERCRRISRIYLINLIKKNKGKSKEIIQCLKKWKNIKNKDISIYSVISELEYKVFKIPVVEANNAYYCDREIDEILDFYNLKDDFYVKKECKRFSKVDLDILILIAKNIDSKAWLYGGYIDWSLINM